MHCMEVAKTNLKFGGKNLANCYETMAIWWRLKQPSASSVLLAICLRRRRNG